MAKLSQLKDLLAAAQPKLAKPATAAPPAPVQSATAKRAIAATKHADRDLDLSAAFADVQRLKPANKAAISRPRPLPVPHNTLADERDVLEASKYDEPTPQACDAGQVFEHEQTSRWQIELY